MEAHEFTKCLQTYCRACQRTVSETVDARGLCAAHAARPVIPARKLRTGVYSQTGVYSPHGESYDSQLQEYIDDLGHEAFAPGHGDLG